MKEVLSLQSTRTIIRPIQPGDCAEVFVYRSDKEANRFQSWVPDSVEEVEQHFFREAITFNSPGTWFQLVILDRTSNAILGDIGVHFVSGNENLQCELGITLSKQQQGKGYAEEALRVVIDHLLLDLGKHRITASIDPANLPSLRLFERLGFRKEAHFVESLFIDGEWVDDVIYGLLRREWNIGTEE